MTDLAPHEQALARIDARMAANAAMPPAELAAWAEDRRARTIAIDAILADEPPAEGSDS